MRICVLLEGTSQNPFSPVLAAVAPLLEARGVSVTLLRLDETPVRLDTLAVEADLYLHASDTELALSLAAGLEQIGARVLNRGSATLLARDRVLAAATLTRAGVPIPRSLAAARPERLGPHLAAGPLVVKPGREVGAPTPKLVETPEMLPGADAYPGVVFAQRDVPGAGGELHVFAIGDDLFGLRRVSPPAAAEDAPEAEPVGEPCRLSPPVEDLTRRCGQALGLDLYGLDVVEDEAGPWVVDVDCFPGYGGVPDALRRLAGYVLQAARATPTPPASRPA